MEEAGGANAMCRRRWEEEKQVKGRKERREEKEECGGKIVSFFFVRAAYRLCSWQARWRNGMRVAAGATRYVHVHAQVNPPAALEVPVEGVGRWMDADADMVKAQVGFKSSLKQIWYTAASKS